MTTVKIQDLFDNIKAVLPASDIDHHYSDLYCRVTRETMNIVHRYEYRNMVKTFKDQVTGSLWYEIPFAYPGKWDK